ncbi:MAG: AI-2E family transporter [Geminicoccaceae bacterium]|nr:AI-2E family transporter [Geminicoccaceae bacterium]
MNHGVRLLVIALTPLLILSLAVLLFNDIMLPFLVGMAAAYLLDPVADYLERHRFRRGTATALITGLFCILLVVFLVLLLPPLAAQAAELALELPQYVERLRARLLPFVGQFLSEAELSIDLSAEGLLQRFAGQAIGVVATAVTGLLQSGIAFLNLIALIFVTPVVTFYLLRDWDRMVAKIRDNIPPDLLPTVMRLAREIDEVLAGFIRGQVLVCGFLALFYGLLLWAVGLRYGLIIGLLTGFFSFIPYIGMALGLAVGLSVAAFQFQSIGMILLVALIFGLGQFIEGNLISPRLVGSRIHLHPVWMIFAALGGAALFGLIGTLIAVPVAGVLGVLLRFGLERYRESRLYSEPPRLAG